MTVSRSQVPSSHDVISSHCQQPQERDCLPPLILYIAEVYNVLFIVVPRLPSVRNTSTEDTKMFVHVCLMGWSEARNMKRTCHKTDGVSNFTNKLNISDKTMKTAWKKSKHWQTLTPNQTRVLLRWSASCKGWNLHAGTVLRWDVQVLSQPESTRGLRIFFSFLMNCSQRCCALSISDPTEASHAPC